MSCMDQLRCRIEHFQGYSGDSRLEDGYAESNICIWINVKSRQLSVGIMNTLQAYHQGVGFAPILVASKFLDQLQHTLKRNKSGLMTVLMCLTEKAHRMEKFRLSH